MIEIDFSVSVGLAFPAKYEQIIKLAITATLKDQNYNHPCEVSVAIVSNEEIRSLNHQYRGKDAVTDVLSFPNSPPILGDIIIALPHATAQAAELSHSLERELAFLATHSTLHLLGYDHQTPDAEEEMCNIQRRIMQCLEL